MRQLPALVLLMACATVDEPVVVDDTGPEGPVEPETPDWLEHWHVTGQEGTVVAVQRAQGTESAKRQVYGMFGDSLQGITTAPWCQVGGPCLQDLPAEPGQFVESDRRRVVPGASTWNWNGDALDVGETWVPFTYTPGGPAWYRLDMNGGWEGTPLPVHFNGEWGPWTGMIDIPKELEILGPDPGVALPIGEVVKLRWTARNRKNLYLRVWGGEVERVYRLEDDGAFDLDPSTLPIPSDRLQLALGRWIVDHHDVHGNELTVIGVWEQPYTTLSCQPSDYPLAPINGGPYLPPLPTVAPAFVGVTFQGVADNGAIYDFLLDQDQDGYEELYSALAIFDIYDADFNTLCQVYYDGVRALPTTPGAPEVGNGVIFAGFDLPLVNGYSNCNAISSAIWGTDDVRQVLESTTWGFGFGSMDLAAAPLADAYGFQWSQVQPLLAGYYLERGGEWHEIGGAWNFRMQTCGVVEPTLTAQPRPTGAPLPLGLYLGFPSFVLPFGAP